MLIQIGGHFRDAAAREVIRRSAQGEPATAEPEMGQLRLWFLAQGDGDTDPIANEILRVAGHVHVNRDRRIRDHEFVQATTEQTRGERQGRPDAQMTDDLLLGADLHRSAVDVTENRETVLVKALADFRHAGAAGGAMDKGNLGRLFDELSVLGDRRRGDAQLPRGGGEASGL